MSHFAANQGPDRPAPHPADPSDHAVVCVATEDGEVDPAALLADADGITAESVTDPAAALDAVEDADCVVCGTAEGDATECLSLLEQVRERAETVPFVLVVRDPSPEALDRLFESDRCAVVPVEPGALDGRLARRVRETVVHSQSVGRARQALAAIDAVQEGIAVVTADGTFALANRSFARQFGTTTDAMRGTHWRTLFTDAAVDRLEADAFGAVADGWEWIGTCEGARLDGEPISLQTRVTAVADDEFVLMVTRPQLRDSD